MFCLRSTVQPSSPKEINLSSISLPFILLFIIKVDSVQQFTVYINIYIYYMVCVQISVFFSRNYNACVCSEVEHTCVCVCGTHIHNVCTRYYECVHTHYYNYSAALYKIHLKLNCFHCSPCMCVCITYLYPTTTVICHVFNNLK